MTITRIGTNSKYASGWASIFGKSAGTTKAAAVKPAKKAAPKKKTAKKKK